MRTSFLTAITRAMFPHAQVDVYLAPDEPVYIARATFRQRDVARWTTEEAARQMQRCFRPQVKDRKRHTSRFWARRVRG